MRRPFGKTKNGKPVEALTLHAGDLSVTILTLGATLQDVRLAGVDHSLTLGANDVAAYEAEMRYFGSLVGPVANRISNASAMLNGEKLTFEHSDGPHTLHGGPSGMDLEVWTVEQLSDTSLTLSLTLPDQKGGFPGNRNLRAHFSVDAPAHLRMEVEAVSDADTLINIANHSYWNLDAHATNETHRFTSPATQRVVLDDDLMPTGAVADVEGTEFDFRKGGQMGAEFPRMDANLCLPDQSGALQYACTLTGSNGVNLRMDTNQPGLQIYDAAKQNSGSFIGTNGKAYRAYCGIALEAQRWPDAPNQPNFPSCVLKAGETYRQETVWSFSRAD